MRTALTLSLLAALAAAGCASRLSSDAGMAGGGMADPVRAAVATLSPAASGAVTGIVTFTANGEHQVGVHVVATGLAPGSTHGFHVHENGNCASADFMSAGGHFNPEHHKHGPQDGEHHAGDMPGLLADPNGRIDSSFTLSGVSLGGPQGFVGRAVILHAGPDDYATQPTGNSGGRLACGVIAAS